MVDALNPTDEGGAASWLSTADISAKTLIADSDAMFYGIIGGNPTAAPVYLFLYDAADIADVTPGTTVPAMVIMMPAQSDGNGGGIAHSLTIGRRFKNGIVILGNANLDPTSISAVGSPYLVNLFYFA